MAGLFNVHPKDGTTINGFPGNNSSPYHLISANWEEGKREKILYESGEIGGVIKDISHGLVEVTLLIAIGGDDESDVSANARTLNQAFRNPSGGTIEFRPPGFSSNVLSTFYHYLQSRLSKRIADKASIPNGLWAVAEVHEFAIQINAWATSDPNNLINIASLTVQNYDASPAIIGESLFRGDVFFPRFSIADLTIGSTLDQVLFHLADVGSSDPALDLYDGGATLTSNFAFDPLNDVRYQSGNGVSIGILGWDIPSTITRKYTGKVAPLVVYSSNMYQVVNSLQAAMRIGTGQLRVYVNDELPLPPETSTYGWTMAFLGEFNFPLHEVPDSLSNLGIALENESVEVIARYGTPTTPTNRFRINVLYLLNVTPPNWAALFEKNDSSSELSLTTNLVIDGVEGIHYMLDTSNNSLEGTWLKYGNPIPSMVFPSNTSYQVRCLTRGFTGPNADDIGRGNESKAVNVDVIFGTIYPFEEIP